jgi:hypothetical protein
MQVLRYVEFVVLDDEAQRTGKHFKLLAPMIPAWGMTAAFELAILLKARAIWTFDKQRAPGEYGFFPQCREAHVFEMNKDSEIDGSEAIGPKQLVDRINSADTPLRFAVVRMKKRQSKEEPDERQKKHTIRTIADQCEEGLQSLLRLLWMYGAEATTANPQGHAWLSDSIFDFGFKYLQAKTSQNIKSENELVQCAAFIKELSQQVAAGRGTIDQQARPIMVDNLRLIGQACEFYLHFVVSRVGKEEYDVITHGVCVQDDTMREGAHRQRESRSRDRRSRDNLRRRLK